MALVNKMRGLISLVGQSVVYEEGSELLGEMTKK